MIPTVINRWAIRRLLEAYVDEELPPKETLAIDRWLQKDLALAAECQELRGLNETLRQTLGEPDRSLRPAMVGGSIQPSRRGKLRMWLAEWYQDLSGEPFVVAGTIALALLIAAIPIMGGGIPLIP